MRMLILGGTAWLGGELVRAARAGGHEIAVLARGVSGALPEGVLAFVADRDHRDAYAEAALHDWDAVVDVTRHPGHARGAVTALGARTRHWVFVSSASVYADTATRGVDESGALLPPLVGERLENPEDYGSAKVACESAVRDGIETHRALIARVSLIGGPGDHTGRSGYWPLRFARPADPAGRVLVPDADTPVQLIDVRDLAIWLVRIAETRTAGVFNVGGETLPLPGHLAVARAVAGFEGTVVARDTAWLAAHDVGPWAGPRSLPLWLPDEDAGLGAHPTERAVAAGLVRRPLEQTLAETLAWELAQGVSRARRAGLTDAEERELLGASAETRAG
ncbi:MAG: NAD-dependent epimerase/dehydratase family protein [Protaetiibacter sp.]